MDAIGPQQMISQHWLRQWLGAVRQQAITWASLDLVPCRHMAFPWPEHESTMLDIVHYMMWIHYGIWYNWNKAKDDTTLCIINEFYYICCHKNDQSATKLCAWFVQQLMCMTCKLYRAFCNRNKVPQTVCLVYELDLTFCDIKRPEQN